MSNLGIIINRIHQGLTKSYAFNEVKRWGDNVRDTRDDLKVITCTEGKDMVAYMMMFDHLGCYICIVRIISGRIEDQVAAWIFIPREIEIPNKELFQVIEKTTDEILKSQIDVELLTGLFSKEYPDKTVPAEYAASIGSDYAFRYYGIGTEYSLQELLGGLYQPYYSKYKAVFLLDKASNAQCRGNDLSEEEIRVIVILSQPKLNLDGFVPYFENENSAFASPKCVALRQQIKVTWRRSGYEDIQKNFVVEEDGQQAPSITADDYMRIISKKDFHISDSDGNKIENFNVVIGKHTIDGQYSLKYKETELRSPKSVTIDAKGFEPLNVDCNLLDSPINLTVKRQMHLCKFMIPLCNGAHISTEEITFKEAFSESPINGYCLDSSPRKDGKCLVYYLRYRGSNEQRGKRVNDYSKNGTDEYDKGFKKGYDAGKRDELQRIGGKHLFGIHPLIALLLSFVLGAIISISCVSLFSSGNKESTEKVPPTDDELGQMEAPPNGNTQAADNKNIDSAIEYLEQNEPWLKDSMEKSPVLQGLFDEMNTSKYVLIVGREDLLISDRFKALCDSIKGFSTLSGSSYCTDNAITLTTYIEYAQKKERDTTVNYLKSKKIWKKEDMDKMPYLQGLFDALIAYNGNEIDRISSRLGSPQILKDIVAKMKDLNLSPYSEDDNSITVKKYKDRLNPPPSKKESTTGNQYDSKNG